MLSRIFQTNVVYINCMKQLFCCASHEHGQTANIFCEIHFIQFDAWERGARLVGYRLSVLTDLRRAVSVILQRIRDVGFNAVPLNTDYIFHPDSKDLM